MKRVKRQIVWVIVAASVLAATVTGAFSAAYDGIYAQRDVMVSYNDEYVMFPGGRPRIVNGSTVAPVLDLFDEFGAEVEYNNTSKLITATLGETAVSLRAGERRLTVTRGGETTSILMASAPFVDSETGSTYAPVRAIAEAFGFRVGWQDSVKMVHIVNFEPLLDSVDGKFTIFEKFMQSSLSPGHTYRSAVSANIVIESLMEGFELSLPMSIKAEVIQKEMNTDGTMTFSIDVSGLGASELMTEEEREIIEALKGVEMDMKIDSESSTCYIRSGLFEIMGQAGAPGTVPDADTWIAISAEELTSFYSQMGLNIDYESIFKGETPKTVRDMLEMQIDMSAGEVGAYTYETVEQITNIMKTFFSDDLFVKSVSGTDSTYTLENGGALLRAYLYGSGAGDFENAEYSIVIKEKDDLLADYEIKFAIEDKKSGLAMRFECSGVGNSSENASFEMVSSGAFRMAFEMYSTMEEASGMVSSKPGEDEKVISFSELLKLS